MTKIDKEKLEEGKELLLDFSKLSQVAETKQNVIPVVVQNVDSMEVLVLAYVNQEALSYSVENKIAAFWSTSRNELWIKGATSGDYLEVKEIRVNCEQNSLVYLVRPKNPGTCHTKDENNQTRRTCYYRKYEDGELVFI